MNALAYLIQRAAREHGPREALVGADESLGFAQVDEQSGRLASFLAHGLGVGKGERVAILLPNSARFVVADFALVKAGLLRVPVNPRYTAPEIEYILAHSGAAALVTSALFADIVQDIRGRLPALKAVVAVDDGLAGALPWGETLAQGTDPAFAVDTVDADGYMIAYTSGTTGRPKGAVTTVGARWANILHCYANETFVGSEDVMLHVASLAHGTGTKVMPFFARGAKNVVLPRFTPGEFFAAVQRHRATVSWMVPTMVAMLADAPERLQHDTSSLHTIVYGGAAMPEPVLQRAMAAFGPVFVQIYGLTEAPHPDIVLARTDHLPGPTGRRKAPGAAGRVAVGVQVRLLGDDGRVVERGEVGEIAIAGKHVMSGYWNDPQATAQTLRDGWCHTGDMAREDEHGFLHIVDRKKDMIISGGYNVYPREVEDVLYRHPAMAECAVIGTPDDTWGETVHAVAVPRPGMTVDLADISAHCASQLAGYKKPRRLTLLPSLPKTANGKVDKKRLRAMLKDERSASLNGEATA